MFFVCNPDPGQGIIVLCISCPNYQVTGNVCMNESSTLTLVFGLPPSNQTTGAVHNEESCALDTEDLGFRSQWSVAANDLKKTVKAAGKRGGSDTIHVWHICLHLVDFYGKCG